MGNGTSDRGELGQLLYGLRTDAKLSQEQLAHAAGVSVRALADLERGRARGPRRRTVRAIADALGLDEVGGRALERAAAAGRPRPPVDGAPAIRGALALPRDIADFTARGPALDRLRSLVERADGEHAPVAVISGEPGLGKTSFAVHAAHRLAEHHPDGQFAVDLHGMGREPTSVRDALAALLRAAGVAESAVPAGTGDRSGLWRSVVRDRRVLVLLDDAAGEEQVRPLLPGAGRSLTIVTSRQALAGLESVHRCDLGVLRREEAVELMTRIVGPERVGREAQAARDIVDLCGLLPLAVRIAGQRLAARPDEHLGKLAARLADEGRRLDTLQAGSLQVRAVFALSYRQLGPAARRVFRRAALAAGPDLSPEVAALLADLPIAQAARCAEELTDAGLLQPHPTAERYRFHDLLKVFAGEQLAAEDGPEGSRSALDRADRWILRRACAAALRFDADHHQDAPHGDPDPDSRPADRDAARAWLEAERASWLAALRRAAHAGRHREVIDTAEAMHWFSDLNQHWELWAEVFRRSSDAARALGNRKEEAVHLNYLAWAYNICVYDHHAALAAAVAALTAAREVGDELQVGWALGYGAGALSRTGRVAESIAWLREAAACLGALGSVQAHLGELSVLNTLGNTLRQHGRAEEALEVHRRAEVICRTGTPGRSAHLAEMYGAIVQQNIGNDLAALGRWHEAEPELSSALARFDARDVKAWSAPALLDLGRVLARLGRHREAFEILTAAREALDALNSPRRQEAAAELDALGAVR
ncbi:tetratricopeptide repeat protein [Kitasatospora sp. NPDC058218]|uniref:tetratricopeptide repeat protein n=1 Tax=Kitasatospora sp. NPDC058218 TaxID=3346385 RepID=UPI0036D8EA53